MGKHRHIPVAPIFSPREKPRPYTEWSEKELQDKIYELEYRRTTLPKYPNVRVAEIHDILTKEIKLLYGVLEAKKNERESKKDIQ